MPKGGLVDSWSEESRREWKGHIVRALILSAMIFMTLRNSFQILKPFHVIFMDHKLILQFTPKVKENQSYLRLIWKIE